MQQQDMQTERGSGATEIQDHVHIHRLRPKHLNGTTDILCRPCTAADRQAWDYGAPTTCAI